MPHKNVVSWTSLISSYALHGFLRTSVALFTEMLESTVKPNTHTFSLMIHECTTSCLSVLGIQIHCLVIKFGFEKDEFLGSALVDFYLKVWNNMDEAFRVFDGLWRRDRVTWNVLISGLADVSDVGEVLRLFREMRVADELRPNDYTLTSLLKCCSLIIEVDQIHGLAMKYGMDSDVVVGSGLVDMYGKCGKLDKGRKVFDSMEVKDIFSWSSIIASYVRNGSPEQAVTLFLHMCRQGVKPDQHVLSSVLRACAEAGNLESGIQVHAQMIKNAYQADCFVGSALMSIYANAEELGSVEKLFRRIENKDIVAWNCILMCYAQKEELATFYSISLFRELCQTSTVRPDMATLVALIASCQSVLDLAVGIQIHGLIMKRRVGCETSIGNAVIIMYSNCGSILDAYKAFDDIVNKDEISWSSIIGSHLQNGFELEAVNLCKEMLAEGIYLTSFSLPLCIAASAKLAAIDLGKQFHSFFVKLGLEGDIFVGSSIVDMYAKCGNVEASQKAFKELQEPNVVSFNTMISGFARQGNAAKAIELYGEMEKMGIVPNGVTFLALLSGCSHMGLVENSLAFFNIMCQKYNIEPEPEHFACLVDVLGRAGRLEEAYCIIENDGSVLAWKTLLSACRNYENTKLAEKCATKVMQFDPTDHSSYVLLSNLYSREGKWEEASKLRQKLVNVGGKKNLGSSWLM